MSNAADLLIANNPDRITLGAGALQVLWMNEVRAHRSIGLTPLSFVEFLEEYIASDAEAHERAIQAETEAEWAEMGREENA